MADTQHLRSYSVVLDDGAARDCAVSRYRSIDMALRDGVRSAAQVAFEAMDGEWGSRSIECVVEDTITGERTSAAVSVSIVKPSRRH